MKRKKWEPRSLVRTSSIYRVLTFFSKCNLSLLVDFMRRYGTRSSCSHAIVEEDWHRLQFCARHGPKGFL